MSIKLYYSPDTRAADKRLFAILSSCRPAILIVPETCTYAYEQRLCGAFGALGFSDVEVLSFSRLCHKLLSQGPFAVRPLHPAGKIMAISQILSMNKNKLRVLGASGNGLASSLVTLFSEFRRYMVTSDKLKEACDNLPVGLLREKLCDITLLYEGYEKFLDSGYTDSDDDLLRLSKIAFDNTYICGRHIFVLQFTSFTPDQTEVLAALSASSHLSVFFPCDAYASGAQHRSAQRSAAMLEKLCYERGTSVLPSENIDEEADIAPSDLAHLSTHFFDIKPQSYDSTPENISLFCAKDRNSEITCVARRVTELMSSGVRLQDISVVCRDNTPYLPVFKEIFDRFGIPFFDNTKTPVSHHPVALFVLSAVSVITSGFSYSSVFTYLKTGYTDLSDDEINYLEAYVLASGVRGDAWIKPEKWRYSYGAYSNRRHADKDEEMFDRLDVLRRRVSTPLLKLKEDISGRRTAKEFTAGLYKFMNDMRLPEKLDVQAKQLEKAGRMALSAEFGRAFNCITDALVALVNVSGDTKMGPRRFLDALTAGLGAVELTIVPPSADQLSCGTITRMRGTNPEYVFLVGVNDGVFPAISSSAGLLTDSDRTALSSKIDLAPDSKSAVYEEQALVKSALSLATKKLYISYPTAASDGSMLRPSSVIGTVKKLFPHLSEDTDLLGLSAEAQVTAASATFLPMLDGLRAVFDGQAVDPDWLSVYGWFLNSSDWREKTQHAVSAFSDTYSSTPLTPEQTEKLFPFEWTTSISRLETYKGCPFRYFVRYVLHAQEKTTAALDSLSKGSLLHSVVEQFCLEVKTNGMSWHAVTDTYIHERVSKILDDMLPNLQTYLYTTSRRVQHQFMRLFRMCEKSIKLLCAHLTAGLFEPLGYELTFDDDGDLAPITIDLPGSRVRLRGKIDRADVYKNERGKFVRVIDYKSGGRTFDLSSVYAGLSLQLCIYITALSESEGMTPAGMLYFKLDDPLVYEDLSDKEKIDKKRISALKTSGILLEDEEIIRAHGASDPKSLIPVRVTKDGYKGNFLTVDEFKLLSAHAKKTAARIAREMRSGKFPIAPVKSKGTSPCDWCPYGGICSSCTEKCISETVSMNKDEIISAIVADTNGGDSI